MDIFIQDLRYAFRSLGRAKGFAAVVVAVMGLGIGVNLLVFAMVDGMLFRPWPLPQPERIVAVNMTEPARNWTQLNWSYMNLEDLRARSKSFSHVGGLWTVNAIVTLDRDPEKFAAAAITADLFPALGVMPALGRNFRHDEESWGRNFDQVIISDRIWRNRYHADPRTLGRTLRLNGRTRAIVGIMPRSFGYPEIQDFWIPIGFNPATDFRNDQSVRVVARLAPGVTVAQADAETRGIVAGIAKEYPYFRVNSAHVLPLQENWVSGIRPVLIVMLLAVLFVLLIACANVANLMLARAAVRRREISLRLALGATRGRIVRQLLTESLVLAVMGAAFGRLVSYWFGLYELVAIPVEKPFFLDFSVGPRAYGFIVLVTVLTAVLSGLAPAWQAADVKLGESLRDGNAQGGSSRAQKRLRHGLVVAEIALSLVLLVGAGLMVRTMQRFQSEGDSLRVDGLVTGRVLLPVALYPDESDRRAFFHEMERRLHEQPGVTEVSAFTNLPLGRDNNGALALTPADTDPHHGVYTNTTNVLPTGFHTLGVPLLHGREFNSSDDDRGARVAVLSEALAKRLWPGHDAVGERIKLVGEPDSLGWRTVVGVVGNMTTNVETDEPTMNALYIPEYQDTQQMLSVIVRSPGDEARGAAALRQVVRSLNPDLAVMDLRSMREELKFSLWVRRLFGGLIGMFGLIALLIAGVGLYGVMAYSVAQRTQEIGVRMALGADAGGVQRLIVGGALKLTLIGIGIGLVAALAVTRFMTGAIQGVSPTDPPTFTLVTLTLLLSGVIAAWVPSLRATRVDPVRALRAE